MKYILILEDDEDLALGIEMALREQDIVRGLECGADDYITKPFSTMVLRARIRALLRRTMEESENNYEQGPFRFYFSRMEFYKNGCVIELSKTEQRILYLLLESRRVF